MSKISPCLWFVSEAEEAATFYVSLLPDSRIERVQRNVMDSPGGGEPCEYTHAVSFHIGCADQAEVDRLWDALTAGGGTPVQCGWLRDRYGVSWQIVPTELHRMLADPDQAKAQRVMQALLRMVKLDLEALRRAYAGTPAA